MLTSEIKRKAQQLGFSACGIIPANSFAEYNQYLDERVKSFPESKKLYEPLYEMAVLPENVKSIIVCSQEYAKYKIPDSLNGLIGRSLLCDGRIPYSYEFRAKLEFSDYLKTLGLDVSQPEIPNRWAAAKAGIGKFGRNNFIFSAEHGSFIRIAAWLVDKELEYDVMEEEALASACSESCQKCVQACPTKALSSALSMDRGKCVAQLSFFAKDALSEDVRAQMGRWMYGCDVCQDVCPLNKGKLKEKEEFPLLSDIEASLEYESILEMDESAYINIIFPRFWYTGKDGLWRWKCGALRSMINSGDEKYYKTIKKYCGHADAYISETARWGCGILGI